LGESSTGWAFPRDWMASTDATHVVAIDPVSGTDYVTLGDLAVGANNYIAHFEIRQNIPWLGAGAAAHVCSMPSVHADNDYPFLATLSALAGGAYGNEQPIRNNIAQRNLTVLKASSPWKFSFWVGRASAEAVSNVHVDASALRGADPIKLKVDPVVHAAALSAARAANNQASDAITLLDDSRLHVQLGGHVGVLDAKAGTRFEPHLAASQALAVARPAGLLPIDGVANLPRSGVVRVARPANQPLKMNLEIPMPADFGTTEFVDVDIIERTSDGRVLGGIRLRLVR
ncbi:MAG: hypothetical protein JNL79_39565, partial [Myxococcales bacterium]|nr:hypothetical protein [Myxococcales bacterium]